MKLNLTKPIVFLDLETTGVDPAKDRIVEISLAKIMPDGTREVKTRRLNPEMHIPEAASAIHGISDFPRSLQIIVELYRGVRFRGL